MLRSVPSIAEEVGGEAKGKGAPDAGPPQGRAELGAPLRRPPRGAAMALLRARSSSGGGGRRSPTGGGGDLPAAQSADEPGDGATPFLLAAAGAGSKSDTGGTDEPDRPAPGSGTTAGAGAASYVGPSAGAAAGAWPGLAPASVPADAGAPADAAPSAAAAVATPPAAVDPSAGAAVALPPHSIAHRRSAPRLPALSPTADAAVGAGAAAAGAGARVPRGGEFGRADFTDDLIDGDAGNPLSTLDRREWSLADPLRSLSGADGTADPDIDEMLK